MAEHYEQVRQEPARQADPYEIHAEGPLTYFHCYVDEFAPQPPLPLEQPLPTHPILSRTLTVGIVGAGLAATAATGFVIAYHISQGNSQEVKPVSRQQSQRTTSREQTKAQLQLGFRPSTPETIHGNLPSLTNRVAKDQTLKISRKSPKSSEVESFDADNKQNATSLERKPLAVALPETLPPSSIVSFTPTRQQLASRATPLTPKEKKQTLPASKPIDSSFTRVNKIASKEVPPLVSNQVKQQISSPSGTVRKADLDITSPQPNPPQIVTVENTSSESLQTEFTSGVTNSLSTGTKTSLKLMSAPNVPPESVPEVSLNESLVPLNKSLTSSEVVQLPLKLQDFLLFPQQHENTSRITLLPLTHQVAEEIRSSQQIAHFTVRELALQDYQYEWLISSKISASAKVANSLPIYGFIDYQRQVIIVPQSNRATIN